jgi:hypothetical protein
MSVQMIRSLVLCVLFLVSTHVQAAAPTAFRCDVDYDGDDYAVEINLKSGKAAFFDNDSWAIAERLDIRFIETYPGTTEFQFTSDSDDTLKVTFEKETKSGTIESQGYRYAIKCRATTARKLFSGI